MSGKCHDTGQKWSLFYYGKCWSVTDYDTMAGSTYCGNIGHTAFSLETGVLNNAIMSSVFVYTVIGMWAMFSRCFHFLSALENPICL